MNTQATGNILTVHKAQSGVDYLPPKVLKQTTRIVTRAHFWRFQHNSGEIEVSLKIGRYKLSRQNDEVEIGDPKSELTLDKQELKELSDYLHQNYEPLKDGAAQYILVKGKLDTDTVRQLKSFFNKPEKNDILKIIVENDMLPSHLLRGLQQREREKALKEFEKLLDENALEGEW